MTNGSCIHNKFPLHQNGEDRNTTFLTGATIDYKLFIFSTMNTEAEMLVMIYQTIQQHIPDDHLYLQRV
jgi:hypothetical protein